ncbi:hypothetical protein [Dehalobacter sp. 4CP]|uniref:hypothetical protein n=1 Tax=Dehalobacter sp. CP TaxID=2594474 RepID=UPI0039EB0B7A
MPLVAAGPIQENMRTAADSVLPFQKGNGFFRGMLFLVVQINAEFAVLGTSAPA